MKKILLTGLFASLIVAACFAQKPYKVVFYNSSSSTPGSLMVSNRFSKL